jgi:hypothetical protein
MQLRILRDRIYEANAKFLQRNLRGYLARVRFAIIRAEAKRKCDAAVIIQCRVRVYFSVTLVHELRMRRLQRQIRMATKIAKWWTFEWNRFLMDELRRKNAAVVIQANQRTHIHYKAYTTKRWVVVHLQARLRGLMARALYNRLRRERATLIIQTRVSRPRFAKTLAKRKQIVEKKRVHKQGAALRRMMATRIKSSDCMGRAFRCYVARCKRTTLCHERRRRAAIALQRHGRGLGVRQVSKASAHPISVSTFRGMVRSVFMVLFCNLYIWTPLLTLSFSSGSALRFCK